MDESSLFFLRVFFFFKFIGQDCPVLLFFILLSFVCVCVCFFFKMWFFYGHDFYFLINLVIDFFFFFLFITFFGFNWVSFFNRGICVNLYKFTFSISPFLHFQPTNQKWGKLKFFLYSHFSILSQFFIHLFFYPPT